MIRIFWNLQEELFMSSLFRKKPLETLNAQSQSNSLARTLSAFDLTLLGIGCVIGTGIFVITGTVAATGAGPALILSFILAGLACALAAFCYAEFSSSIPISGSVYSYSYITLESRRLFNRLGSHAWICHCAVGGCHGLVVILSIAAAGFNYHIPAAGRSSGKYAGCRV